ncbi:hypothetical protein BD413DRAFT_315201 [Trametes elegans]|nr:hypothetical protein BD413DRAFT_315201 [Trametes elegans]
MDEALHLTPPPAKAEADDPGLLALPAPAERPWRKTQHALHPASLAGPNASVDVAVHTTSAPMSTYHTTTRHRAHGFQSPRRSRRGAATRTATSSAKTGSYGQSIVPLPSVSQYAPTSPQEQQEHPYHSGMAAYREAILPQGQVDDAVPMPYTGEPLHPPAAAHTFLGAQMVHPSTNTNTTEWQSMRFRGVSSTGDAIGGDDQRVNDFLPCGPAAHGTDNPWTALPGPASSAAIAPSGSRSDGHSIYQDAGWRSQTRSMVHAGMYAATSAVDLAPPGEDVFAAAFAVSDAQFGPMPMYDDMDAILNGGVRQRETMMARHWALTAAWESWALTAPWESWARGGTDE